VAARVASPAVQGIFGYKRYGFGILDVHVQLYTNILCMFWFLRKLKGIVSKLTVKFWMCQKCGKMKDYNNNKK
jgi:hypothetical protein